MSDPAGTRPSFLESWGLAILCGLVLVVVLVLWGAGTAGDAINGTAIIGNPFGYVVELIIGKRSWPGLPSTLILIAVGLLAIGAGVLVVRWARRKAREPQMVRRIKSSARLLGRPKDLVPMSPTGVATAAKRLMPRTFDPARPEQHGRLIGVTVVGDMPVRAGWEDLGVHIWGPRRGKTTTVTVPNVIEAPGPVIATSNKRDIVDATRGPRSTRGEVFIFDPQQVATEPPRFWYDPLSRIETITDATTVTAAFVHGTREPDAKTDSYFDGSAENLLSAFMFAAALDGKRSVIDVYRWTTDDRDDTPARILDAADEILVARDVRQILDAPEKQRKGVYDTAKALLACLREKRTLEWVTPPEDGRPEFKPSEFVQSNNTLYLLSMEKKGSAGPLVTCLTEHVCNEGVNAATRSPGGRLDPPMYVAGDEAANVNKWRDLPSLYSHFGSRGVVVDTILQSWSQGLEVWGQHGMTKLWGAANVRTYGGGGAEIEFLRGLAEMAGRADVAKHSTTRDHKGHRSVSANPDRIEKLPVDLLAAMPDGHALVFASRCPFFIVKPQPWMTGQNAEAINASIAKYDPGAL